MSINNSYKMQVIESDGTTTRYNFECFINSKEDLKIKVIDTNGNIKELEYGNDYSVENKFDYYNGGYFNLAKPQERGYTIVIYRETPINQQINFMSLQTISPMNLTKMFDKLTIIAQEINEQFFRAVKFDFTDISLIDQDKPLNESNIKNLNPELNKDKIVALTLKYNETSNKWELYTSTTNPDETREQGTETSYGVFKIATIEEAKTGANDNKVITPLKLKTTLDDRQATNEEVETEQDIKKYVNPKQVGYCIDNRQATDEEIETAEDIKKYINPKQINDYLDNRQATTEEIETEQDIKKYVNPNQLSNYLDNRQATDAEINTAEDIKKYINPKQINDYLDNRQATNSEVETEEDIKKYVNPKQLKDYFGTKQATDIEATTEQDVKKYVNPKQVGYCIDNRQATDEEISTGEDIKKYINPKQLSNTNNNLTTLENTFKENQKHIIIEYSKDISYGRGQMCYSVGLDNKPTLYYSLMDNNLNNSLFDNTAWEVLDMGGGGGTGGDTLMELKENYEITEATSMLEFTTLDPSLTHKFTLDNLQCSNSSGTMLHSTIGYGDNSYVTSNYCWENNVTNSGETYNYIKNKNKGTSYQLTNDKYTDAGIKSTAGTNVELYLYPTNNANEKYMTATVLATTAYSSIKLYKSFSSCLVYDTNQTDRLKFYLASGNFTKGIVKHYTIK